MILALNNPEKIDMTLNKQIKPITVNNFLFGRDLIYHVVKQTVVFQRASISIPLFATFIQQGNNDIVHSTNYKFKLYTYITGQ